MITTKYCSQRIKLFSHPNLSVDGDTISPFYSFLKKISLFCGRDGLFFFCAGTNPSTMGVLTHDKAYCDTNSLQ